MRADRPGRVIVGVGTSLSGLQAVRVAVEQARAQRRELHAVRTWSAPTGSGQPDPRVRMLSGPPGAGPAPGWGAAADAVIGQAFEQVMGGLPADLEVHTVVLPDVPGPVLVEYACRADDLLVLGSGGRSRLRQRWRSRVVRHCLARARCPVLVVPPSQLAAAGQRSLLRELRRELDQLADRGPDW